MANVFKTYKTEAMEITTVVDIPDALYNVRFNRNRAVLKKNAQNQNIFFISLLRESMDDTASQAPQSPATD